MTETAARSPKPTILLQLDTDPQPSVFDAVVAADSGVDHLLRHGSITPGVVRDLVHGLLFTRGGDDLRRSAVFVGGSDVAAGEAVLGAVLATCFGPFRVSVLLDSKGANTTAAAAALAIERSLGPDPDWSLVRVAVLGAGPVGRRVARLLARQGASVQVGSPDHDEARSPIEGLEVPGAAPIRPFRVAGDWAGEIAGATVVVAAGPPGVEILPELGRDLCPDLKVAADLNAVPPHGLGGIKPTDAARDRGGVLSWGALGVGGLKMKIHKAVLRALFVGEPTAFDLEQVFEVARRLAR